MSEYEQYYEACERGMFSDPDKQYCGCKGAGWFLSQVDTWHKCPEHYDGSPDPESQQDYDDDGSAAVEIAPVSVEPPAPPLETTEIDDEIPF